MGDIKEYMEPWVSRLARKEAENASLLVKNEAVKEAIKASAELAKD